MGEAGGENMEMDSIQKVAGAEQESQERREAAAARANYQSAVRALEDVEGRWRQTRERLRALDGLEDRCRALLEEKRRRMAQSDPALGGRIRELEEKLAAVQNALEHSRRTLAFYEIAAKTGSEETAKDLYLARYGEENG